MQDAPSTGDYKVLRVRVRTHLNCSHDNSLNKHNQAFGERLDQWDTDGLFGAEGSKGLLWLILGLGIQPGTASDAQKVYEMASGTSFHRYARVFWAHMLFDVLASQAELEYGRPEVKIPSPDRLDFLRTKEGVKAVRTAKQMIVRCL